MESANKPIEQLERPVQQQPQPAPQTQQLQPVISPTLERLGLWLADNVFLPGRLSTILVLLFLAIFIGIIPSPLLTSIGQSSQEHTALKSEVASLRYLLRQICSNTSKNQQELNQCFFIESR